MGYLVCNKCGSCCELQEGESIDDFDLTCDCGGKFRYEESINSNNKSDLDKIKWILIFAGFVFLIISFARYFEYKSPIDLFYLAIGMMFIIWGFYIKKEFKITTPYLVVVSCVNLVQWLILVYILFISKVYVTNDLFILAFAPLVTISLIIQIRTSDLKYIGNPKNTNKDVILADKLKKLLNNMGKLILKSLGVLIILFCIGSFLFSRDPIELYGSLVGLMVFVYGYYRENKDVMPPNYAPGMHRNSIFVRESSKIKVTSNYFVSMLSVLIVQWLILYYIVFIRPYPVPNEGVPTAFTISIMASMFFYIQIRESDFKYIGRMRKLN